MEINTIGIVLETIEDAHAFLKSNPGKYTLDDLIHWREPEEIQAIQQSIEALGYNTRIIGAPQTLLKELNHWQKEVQFIFNISVGFISRHRLADGPFLFEMAGIPYSGADPYTKLVSQHKPLWKALFDKQNIPTPAWTLLHTDEPLNPTQIPPFPCIVKPAHEGTSVGIYAASKVNALPELKTAIDYLKHRLNMPILIEHFITGRELKVGLAGDKDHPLIGIIEDVDEAGNSLGDRFLHLHAKKEATYQKKAVPTQEYPQLVSWCKQIYKNFWPLHYASFDIRVDTHNNSWFIEFQADASLHPARTLAQCFELNGISFQKLIQTIVHTAIPA